MLATELEGRGLDRSEAQMAAEARFGDPSRMKREAVKGERSRIRKRERVLLMDGLRQDLRFGLRQLWKRPMFSGIALAMLALGIGANTAIFSVVQTVLLRPLPFPATEEILQLWESRQEQGRNRSGFAPANYWDVREMNRTFVDIGAFRWTQVNLTGEDHPTRLSAARVTSGFFGTILGVNPALGRTFLPEEGEAGGASRVTLLAYDFWQSHFGRDPSVLGTSLIPGARGWMPEKYSCPW
jgi:putative ABC transport system permease protein